MINQLKTLFNHAIVDPADASINNEDVVTYETEDKHILSLNRKLLSKDQEELLNVFLKEVKIQTKNHLTDQVFWSHLLFDTGTVDFSTCIEANQYRFLHFFIHGSLNNNTDFIEALENLFDRVTVIWADDNSGVIVEYLNDIEINDDDIQTHKHTIETIMADFYVKISLFSGTPFSSIELAKDIYHWEKSAFELGRRFLPNLLFIEKRDFIPHLLLSETSEITKNVLQTILATENDEELIKTVKVFLECNLNATLAAKKLYIHRNSLQYRIDKFTEKTGIDIKQFQQAVSLYMLIVLEEMKAK